MIVIVQQTHKLVNSEYDISKSWFNPLTTYPGACESIGRPKYTFIWKKIALEESNHVQSSSFQLLYFIIKYLENQ